MGLTIHYSLKAKGSEVNARNLVHALHQTAQDLPFEDVSEVVQLSGEQSDTDKRSQDDPSSWLLTHAGQSIEGEKQNDGWTPLYRVRPHHLIAFTTSPGQGCESASFGLCKYPPVIETRDGRMKTKLSGWCWSNFCKTEYASNPRCGGVTNFLRCHLSVIAVLDRAKQLGCLEEVDDEGGFWTKRDLPALVQEIGSLNELIAAFGGKLKDLAGTGPGQVEAAISEFPNFEQLEAQGQDKLPPKLQKLFSLIGRVAITPRDGLLFH